jgi:hypothetical protein
MHVLSVLCVDPLLRLPVGHSAISEKQTTKAFPLHRWRDSEFDGDSFTSGRQINIWESRCFYGK